MRRENMGDRLVRLRHEAKLSQKQLARAMGIPVENIRNWEHNRRFPGLLMGGRLAKALGVTVEQLIADLAEAEEPEPAKKTPGRTKGGKP
jgi:transcriptional regulator with XRE-family HTH domain